MKSYILLFWAAQQSLCAISQSPTAGRVKISIENVKCNTKCWDGVVEFDGHGNEISVTYAYRIYNNSNPNAARKGADGTVIYGSNINGMTRAGTQTPDLGGIKEGDVVNIFKPMMDEHVNADDYIIIAPTVWEWDGPEKNTINSFNTQLDQDLFWVTHQPFPFANTTVSFTDPFGDRVINPSKYPGYDAGSSKYQDIFKNFLCPTMREGNRPVGIASGTYNNECKVLYQPNLVVLDTRTLYALYANNKSATSGGTSHAEKEAKGSFINGLTVTFNENNYNFPDSHGSYSVMLRIEFIPDATPAPAVTPGTGISKNLPVKNLSITNPALTIAGNWAGIQTNDYGLYPQNIGFELTPAGDYLIKDARGTIAASGKFSISNNIVTGWYKLLSSSDTISFTATYDPAAQKISGSSGMGTAVTGQGKWVVTKK